MLQELGKRENKLPLYKESLRIIFYYCYFIWLLPVLFYIFNFSRTSLKITLVNESPG